MLVNLFLITAHPELLNMSVGRPSPVSDHFEVKKLGKNLPEYQTSLCIVPNLENTTQNNTSK